MPEQPELDAVVGNLREVLVGRRIERIDVTAISVLKTAVPTEELRGRAVTAIDRRGKHLLIEADGLTLVIHLALAGWLRHHATTPASRAGPRKGPLALRIALDDGSALDVTEQGTRKSVAVWITARADQLENLMRLGPEALGLPREELARVLAGSGSRVKTVLTDQRTIVGVGNAWSDEILHRARISPFATANRLDAEVVDRVHEAMETVLGEATTALGEVRLDRIKATKKKLLQVHGRTGEACPVCGHAIAEVSFAERSLQYCPGCQTGGKRLSDRRMDRLLR